MTSYSLLLRAPNLDHINQRTYRSRNVLRQFRAATGWLEPGERMAMESVAEFVRGGAILDIGIGGGRTAPLMTEISEDYRGIDYCSAMIEVARSRFPSLCFLEMDARRLTFLDDSFDLVTFSYNGIDSVDLNGRRDVLREVHRVLRPGGYFVFSVLNRHGVAHGEHWPDWGVFRGIGLSANRLLHGLGRCVVGGVNWLRFHLATAEHEDVAIGHLSAHNFGLVTLFTTVRAQLRQLRDHGFEVGAIFDPDGNSIAPDGSEPTRAPWCHFVARKPISEP